MFEWRQDACFRRNDWVAGEQSRLKPVQVVTRLEAIRQHQAATDPRHYEAVLGVTARVVAFNGRNLDGQQPPLTGFGIEQAHESGQSSEGSGPAESNLSSREQDSTLHGPPLTEHS